MANKSQQVYGRGYHDGRSDQYAEDEMAVVVAGAIGGALYVLWKSPKVQGFVRPKIEKGKQYAYKVLARIRGKKDEQVLLDSVDTDTYTGNENE